jgi:hypothetical protein
MRRLHLPLLLAILQAARLVHAKNETTVIPNQYIVYYEKNADPVATNERLFFSSDSSVASSEDFRVVVEARRAIAIAGITDKQYQELLQDPAVAKVTPVSSNESTVYASFCNIVRMHPLRFSHYSVSRTTEFRLRQSIAGAWTESINPIFLSTIHTTLHTRALESKYTLLTRVLRKAMWIFKVELRAA